MLDGFLAFLPALLGSSSGSSAPSYPDPSVSIPLQAKANKGAFDYSQRATRVNTKTPMSSGTWKRNTAVTGFGTPGAAQKAPGFSAPGNPLLGRPAVGLPNTGTIAAAPPVAPTDGVGQTSTVFSPGWQPHIKSGKNSLIQALDGAGGRERFAYASGSGDGSDGTGVPGGGDPNAGGNNGGGGASEGGTGGDGPSGPGDPASPGAGGPSDPANPNNGQTGTQIDKGPYNLLDDIFGNTADQEDAGWTYEQELSPELQALFDSQTANERHLSGLRSTALDSVGRSLGSSVDTSSLRAQAYAKDRNAGFDSAGSSFDRGDITRSGPQGREIAEILANLRSSKSVTDDLDFGTDDVRDAMYRQSTKYMDTDFGEQQRKLEQRMAEQGFTPTSDGYGKALRGFMDSREKAYGDARDRSILSGEQAMMNRRSLAMQDRTNRSNQLLSGYQNLGNLNLATDDQNNRAQSQDFSQNLSQRQLMLDALSRASSADNSTVGTNNQSKAQELSQMLALRQLPFAELAALSGGQPVQMPNLQAQYGSPGLAAPNVMGAMDSAYKGQVNQYNAETAESNQMTQALTGFLKNIFGK